MSKEKKALPHGAPPCAGRAPRRARGSQEGSRGLSAPAAVRKHEQEGEEEEEEERRRPEKTMRSMPFYFDRLDAFLPSFLSPPLLLSQNRSNNAGDARKKTSRPTSPGGERPRRSRARGESKRRSTAPKSKRQSRAADETTSPSTYSSSFDLDALSARLSELEQRAARPRRPGWALPRGRDAARRRRLGEGGPARREGGRAPAFSLAAAAGQQQERVGGGGGGEAKEEEEEEKKKKKEGQKKARAAEARPPPRASPTPRATPRGCAASAARRSACRPPPSAVRGCRRFRRPLLFLRAPPPLPLPPPSPPPSSLPSLRLEDLEDCTSSSSARWGPWWRRG